MSLPEQEEFAMRRAWSFLLRLSSGEIKRIPTVTRQEARSIVKHFPLGGDLKAAARRQMREDSLLEEAVVAAREADPERDQGGPKAPPDHLNVP